MKTLSIISGIVLFIISGTAQTSLTSYSQNKIAVISARENFKKQIQKTSERDSVYKAAGAYLHAILKDEMIPAWYGTVWDFFGTSETPGKGKIACGYFVSTTLRDAGFQLNRYKMAQLHSFDEVSSLSGNSFNTTTLDSLHCYLKREGEGLYILGLDNHVGYISFERGTAWFIHSNYLSPACVTKELMYLSPAILSSTHYKIGAITTNIGLMKKWVNGEVIQMKQ
jgi:hypothetical protein